MVDPSSFEGKVEQIVSIVGRCIPSMSNTQEQKLRKELYDGIESLKTEIIANREKIDFSCALRLINVMKVCSKIAHNTSMQTTLSGYCKGFKAFAKKNKLLNE